MNKYLTAAASRYPQTVEQGGEFKIHPISELDAKIISEMLELFRKMRFVDAVEILQNYKFNKDEEILEALEGLNAKVGKVRSGSEVENQPEQPAIFSRYLKTKGRRIDMFLVISYDAVDLPVRDESIIKNCIQLNPTPQNAKNVPYYANELLVFDTPAERDQVLLIMDKWIELYRGLFLKEE